MNQDLKVPRRQNRYLLLVGTLIFIVYYTADCALDSLLFGEGSFSGHLFSPSLHELSIRLLSGVFIFAMFLASAFLINKNKYLQRELLQQSQQLLGSNRELEAYNYALSHALRGSLDRIALAGNKMQSDCGSCPRPEGKELLHKINAGCDRLSSQIDGMLKYSEANNSMLDMRQVALDEIAREIAREITGNTDGEILDFQIDKNLASHCDPDLIRIALKHLIDNAVKFRAPDRPGEIQIGMEERRGVPIYFIRDNGIGFDPADATRVFRPFEPVSANGSSDHGVGLATASTIIERHGGRIWAEGRPQQGATFYFTLGAGERPGPTLN